MPKKSRGIGIYLAILLVLMLIFTMVFSTQREPQTLNYSTVVGYFQQGQVEDFTLDLGSGDLVIRKMNGKETNVTYKVPYIVQFIDDINPFVMEHNLENPTNPIVFTYLPAQDNTVWLTVVPTLLLVGIMIAFWISMMRQTRGSGGNVSGFGKAKARSGQDGRKVTFADVAGADEEKEELVEIVDFLRSPGKYNTLGARIPKGVLLTGPPGTGKTLLARAVAGEADVQFFSISGSDFVEMFVGVGASRVRDLFDQAKKNAPSVVFIDEIDAVGRRRGAGLGGGHDEREQTLNQLLVEMDGFSSNTGVIIIAATNRRDILDPALLRPGRFDRQITINRPDLRGRAEILKVHARNKPLGPDVSLETIAKGTIGFTGADLENLLNESALLAARRNLHAITMTEIEEAKMKVLMGPEKRSHVSTEKDRKMTAYHEAGHAIVGHYCPTQDPVHEVSIISRGGAGGYTLSLPQDDRDYMSKKQMYENIVVYMGGRVAEHLIMDDVTTGASHDLQQATKLARAMVTRYGFSENLGPVVYGNDENQVFIGRDYGSTPEYSQAIAAEIDKEVRAILDAAYQQAMDLVQQYADRLHALAAYLLEYEKIGAEDFKRLMNEGTGHTPPPGRADRDGGMPSAGMPPIIPTMPPVSPQPS